MSGDIVGPAHVQYDEWVGSLAADDVMDSDTELCALVGLDPKRHWILGFKVFRAPAVSHGPGPFVTLSLYAADRSLIPNYESLQMAAKANDGRIPVVEYSTVIKDAEFTAMLDCFKRFEIVARARPQVVDPGYDLFVDRTLAREEGEDWDKGD